MEYWIWLLLALLAFVLELATPSALISIWFSVGALFAALSAYVYPNFTFELTVFMGVSALSFAYFRPIFSKVFKINKQATNADRLIGYEGRLSEEVTPEKWGALNVSGIRYSVISEDNKTLKKDTWVKVVALAGAKLVVKEKS